MEQLIARMDRWLAENRPDYYALLQPGGDSRTVRFFGIRSERLLTPVPRPCGARCGGSCGRALEKRWPLKSSFGWYDLAITTDADRNFLRRVAGHLENDRDSVSDPALGGVSHDVRVDMEA